MSFVKKYNINARITRIFNTYGPKMEKDDGRVISNFVNQAIRKKPITVYGNGSQTRSFCFISDMVAGLIKAMETSNTSGEVFNLGSTDERTVLDIAQLVKKMTESGSEIVFKKLPEDDPAQRRPDIKKAKKFLNWTPQVDLEQGLKETIDYFRLL